MIRSVFVAGTAVGVLALGSLTAAAGNAHPSALTHVGATGSAAAEEQGGARTALAQAVHTTATDAENTTAHVQTQPQAQAQTETQDEDTTENDGAAENDTGEVDDAAEQAGAAASAQQPATEPDSEQAPTSGGAEGGGD